MIKQIVGVLLCLSLVLVPGFVGEMIPKAAGEEGYELYFLVEEYEDAAGGGALSTQWVDLTAEDTQALATGLVEKLLEGPTEEGLKSAIPSGTSLLSLETRGGRAIVDLSASYGSLSGIALTLADYAITLTLTVDGDLEVTESVVVTALDLTSLPQLTANMPVEVKITTDVKLNRENISIEEPEDADRYEEVPLSELLPPEAETETP